MYVCHCRAVTDKTVDAVIGAGARSVDEITERCHAGGGCGGCRETLRALLDAAEQWAELSALSSSSAA